MGLLRGILIVTVCHLHLVSGDNGHPSKAGPLSFTLITAEPRITVLLGDKPNSPGYVGAVEEVTSGHSVLSFKGIPYAKPPLGELRYKVNIKFPNHNSIPTERLRLQIRHLILTHSPLSRLWRAKYEMQLNSVHPVFNGIYLGTKM